MLVLLGVLFTIILAGLDNTIVSTVMPVALPELGGAHMYAWTFAAYMLAAAVSMPIWGFSLAGNRAIASWISLIVLIVFAALPRAAGSGAASFAFSSATQHLRRLQAATVSPDTA